MTLRDLGRFRVGPGRRRRNVVLCVQARLMKIPPCALAIWPCRCMGWNIIVVLMNRNRTMTLGHIQRRVVG